MFLYLTQGTNDVARAKIFYDAALAPLGFVLRYEDAAELGYGAADDSRIALWITTPFDASRPASHGNGAMIAFRAPSRAAVADFHAAGCAHGGIDDGAPGLRPYGPIFYACYLRDPDGNKLSAVCEAAVP